jgi:hypothetical protein
MFQHLDLRRPINHQPLPALLDLCAQLRRDFSFRVRVGKDEWDWRIGGEEGVDNRFADLRSTGGPEDSAKAADAR